MKVRLLFFAALRDVAGKAEEDVALPDGVRTMEELARYLDARPELTGRLGSTRFALNETFAAPGEVLKDGDVIALIPPVSGG